MNAGGTVAAPALGRLVFWLATASFGGGASYRAAEPLLPAIARDLGVTSSDAAIVIAVYGMVFGLCQLVYGAFGDRWGKTRVVILSTVASALACVLCALAPTLATLTVARALLAASAAGITPVALAVIGDAVPYERRQIVIARFLLGLTLGFIFGQAAGGIIGEALGWRAFFVVQGALFLTAALGLRFETGPLRGPEAGAVPVSFGRAYADLFGLFRLRGVQIVVGAALVEGILTNGVLSFMGAHLQEAIGLRLDHAGMLLALFGIGALTGVATLPFYFPRLGERGLLVVGGALLGASYLGAAVSPVWWPFLAVMLMNGIGFGMIHSTLQTLATQMAPAARGAAMSLFTSGYAIGGSVGTFLTGLVYGEAGAAPAFAAAGLALPLLALALSVWAGRSGLRREAA